MEYGDGARTTLVSICFDSSPEANRTEELVQTVLRVMGLGLILAHAGKNKRLLVSSGVSDQFLFAKFSTTYTERAYDVIVDTLSNYYINDSIYS